MTYRFVVVGVGGVGTWLVQGLARQLEWRAPGSGLILVDGDNFEPKNKERQNFKGVGNKAEVVASELVAEFPQTYIVPQPVWIVENVVEQEPLEEDGEMPSASKVRAVDLLCEGDVVYAVVDNDACRKVLIEAAAKLDNVDLFTAGNDDGYYYSAYHYRRRDGEDITVNPLENHPEYESPSDRNPGDLSCQERAELEGGTQLIGTNMGVAAYLLSRTNMVIFDGLDPTEMETDEFFCDVKAGRALGYSRSAEKVAIAAN